jgi:hypothetical protein
MNPCHQQRFVSIRIRIVSDATGFEVVVTWIEHTHISVGCEKLYYGTGNNAWEV